ncbi:MAG: hypothetical protein RLZZ393_350, partial [Pseudomonadota bacterium]
GPRAHAQCFRRQVFDMAFGDMARKRERCPRCSVDRATGIRVLTGFGGSSSRRGQGNRRQQGRTEYGTTVQSGRLVRHAQRPSKCLVFTFQPGLVQSTQSAPLNQVAARLSPFSCQLNQADATRA